MSYSARSIILQNMINLACENIYVLTLQFNQVKKGLPTQISASVEFQVCKKGEYLLSSFFALEK